MLVPTRPSTTPILEVDVDFTHELAVVRLVGELDIGSEHLLTDAVRCVAARTSQSPRQVVIDLSSVTFCDVAGLRAIENSAFALSRAGSELVVRHPSQAVLRLVALKAETRP
jgi:anti-anti-sigma factor